MFSVIESTSRQSHKHLVQLCYRCHLCVNFFFLFIPQVCLNVVKFDTMSKKTRASSQGLDISWIPPLSLYLPGSGQALPRSSSLLNLHSPLEWKAYVWQKAGCDTTSWRKERGLMWGQAGPSLACSAAARWLFLRERWLGEWGQIVNRSRWDITKHGGITCMRGIWRSSFSSSPQPNDLRDIG